VRARGKRLVARSLRSGWPHISIDCKEMPATKPKNCRSCLCCSRRGLCGLFFSLIGNVKCRRRSPSYMRRSRWVTSRHRQASSKSSHHCYYRCTGHRLTSGHGLNGYARQVQPECESILQQLRWRNKGMIHSARHLQRIGTTLFHTSIITPVRDGTV